MRVIEAPNLDELNLNSRDRPHITPVTQPNAGRVLSHVSVACGVFLMALVAWFTFFLAGATIDAGTFYTGPVGAVFGAFLAIGIVLSIGSTVAAFGVRLRAAEGSPERARAWLVWAAANAFFAVGVVAASLIVNVKVG